MKAQLRRTGVGQVGLRSMERGRDGARPGGIIGVHGVRYQVKDVARAATFYTEHLGFKLEHRRAL